MIATAHAHTSGEPRLDAIERKLDLVLERQRAVSELLEVLAPVAKEMMSVATVRLEDLEKKGYFVAGKEVLRIVDTVVTSYGEEDLRSLGDNIVTILDTVRNLTQPEVLEVANEATEVLEEADGIAPLGRFGLLKSTGDADVQRGLTLLIAVLRRIGQAHDVPRTTPSRRSRTPSPEAPPRSTRERVVEEHPGLAPALDEPVLAPPERATTAWEGATFYDDGFLVDPKSWTPELGTKIAAGLGIELTPEHRKVLEWARADFLDRGASPNVRRVASGSGAGTSQLYALFPKTPGKSIAMIAGIPKPVGCI